VTGDDLHPVAADAGLLLQLAERACDRLLPSSRPPCGICQASRVLSSRWPTQTWPWPLISITPTAGR
jgi:hypothetical protein